MVRRHISDELKEMALSMSLQGLTNPEICDFMGIPDQFSRESPRQRLPKTELVTDDIEFLCDCVERQPDIALKELQTELHEALDAETLLQTIALSPKGGLYHDRDAGVRSEMGFGPGPHWTAPRVRFSPGSGSEPS
ncbi:hypothetical protein EDB85DRAFT_2148068 [Lactarius pseudohatsudake]|nr:hypothetical protein EDB85DRAFT_2148068 [Lactarius pseudohatsudake]